jgi:hypothetical protein
MAIYDNNSLILKLKFLMGYIQNLNRVNQNHSYKENKIFTPNQHIIKLKFCL